MSGITVSGISVNRELLEKEQRMSKERKTIHFLRYTGDQLTHRDLRKFVDVIYRNFYNIQGVTGLKHNKIEILRLLTSPSSIIIICTDGKDMVSYLIAEIVVYNMRRLMHIYYLYTTPAYRNKGIATYTLNLIQDYASELNINALSLTFDTYDKSLTMYYLNNKFNYDPELRSYQRHDMLVKYI